MPRNQVGDWKIVVFGAECDEDDNCPFCLEDFADCPCPGPTQHDEYEYREIDGTLYARPKQGEEHDDED